MRRDAAGSVLLALLFYAFFTSSKHLRVLSDFNPFADDPYDALGSFAVQLAPFLALLSALRAYRPRAREAAAKEPGDLVRRGALLTALAVSIALAGDVVALIRHISLWAFTPAGQCLAAGTVLLLACSLHQVKRYWSKNSLSDGGKQRLILIAGIVGPLVCLAFYPEHVRQTLTGALFTAYFGIILFFLPLGVLAYLAMSPPAPDTPDLIDDVTAVCEYLKRILPIGMPIYTRLDRFQRASLPKRFAAWINPRCFKWRLPGLVGSMTGLALISAEFLSEGTPSLERALLLIAVFVCAEFFGVMIGYGSLARSLHLFRNDQALYHQLAAPSAPVPARRR